jgi:hypothetical protein
MTGGLLFPHRYVFDDIPEKFRGLYALAMSSSSRPSASLMKMSPSRKSN